LKLPNYISGRWMDGSGPGDSLVDPVTGEELARVTSQGVDWDESLKFGRNVGGPELRNLSYRQRADLLTQMAAVFASNRSEYFRISLLNLGANEADASFDVDGAIYTLKFYAKLGTSLGDGSFLKEGGEIPLSKAGVFAGQHFLMPMKGTGVFINAFNFPAWSFCEKAAPALLSGVPILVKPASATAWLTHRMVEDLVSSKILPTGSISLVCGSARDLLDFVHEGDVVSFTGSAETAVRIRGHQNILRHATRLNIEADSINCAVLGPDAQVNSELFDLLIREVQREVTLKAGQKCTAIRRVLVPRQLLNDCADGIAARLGTTKVGNPRLKDVQMGPVVNKAQQSACLEGIRKLKKECTTIFGGNENFQPIDANANLSSFVEPTLLACSDGLSSEYVNDVEVFGPAATLIPYDSIDELIEIVRRAKGSLVGSIFSNDPAVVQNIILGVSDLHGRLMVVDSSVGSQHTGHGNVVPSCLHGGAGRAGGGEELGGLRALQIYHHRFVIQAPPKCLASISDRSTDAGILYS
jgi:3,4-dehydroadipyl-CoA semialdehyde dehydrogenase